MPASTHPDAPARPDASRSASSAPDPPRRRRLAIGAGVAVAILAGVVITHQVITADAAATEAERRAASAEFARDVAAVRTTIADPAREGQTAATALLRHQLSLVAGEVPDPAVGDGLVEQLQAAGAELADAAGTPMPPRPTILPVATVDPVFDRLRGLEEQAADLAVRFEVAADDAASWLAAVRDLDEAALTYAASTEQLPDSDDPDALASAWRAEHERLEPYADAIERAGEHEASAPLADAHALLVDGMGDTTEEAVALLEAGDVDAYNALIADRLSGDDPFGFGAALETARAEIADAAIEGDLEETRARALGLLTELEELRRAAPAQLVELP